MSKRDPFDAFEVHKVAEYHAGYEDAFCEPITTPEEQETADEEASSQFWTVYGYRKWPEDGSLPLDDGHGTTAIADLTTQEAAIDLAYALAQGKPVEIFG